MLDIHLTYSTDNGPQAVSIERDRLSFGRGSEADQRLSDDGLSRLHATVYRDGDNVWIVDENSTNGTFVNGEPVRGAGTPLKDGDVIRIGNHTNMRVSVTRQQAAAIAPPAVASSVPVQTTNSLPSGPINFLPIILIAGAIFVIAITTVVIGFTIFGGSSTTIAQRPQIDPDSDDPEPRGPKPSPTVKAASSPESTAPTNDNSQILSNTTGNSGQQTNVPSGKKYMEMSDAERRAYIEAKAMRVAERIGNNNSEKIPAAATDKIKGFVDGYVQRLKSSHTGGCASRS